MAIIESLRNLMRSTEPSSFVSLPLPVAGKLFVSPMPFGPYDTKNQMLKIYKSHKVKHALVLVTQDEMSRKGKKDLFKFYQNANIQVHHLPFQDYTAPILEEVEKFVPVLVKKLEQHENVVIHCNAGVGRTGVLAACISQNILQCSGEKALQHIREHMMINITDEQKRLINSWAEKTGHKKK